MLIYGIKKLKLAGLRLERFDPEYSPLIPDPMDSKFSYALELVNWIWDQSLMTVEINTITRVTRRVNCMSCNWRRHDHPRSIVTDH